MTGPRRVRPSPGTPCHARWAFALAALAILMPAASSTSRGPLQTFSLGQTRVTVALSNLDINRLDPKAFGDWDSSTR